MLKPFLLFSLLSSVLSIAFNIKNTVLRIQVYNKQPFSSYMRSQASAYRIIMSTPQSLSSPAVLQVPPATSSAPLMKATQSSSSTSSSTSSSSSSSSSTTAAAAAQVQRRKSFHDPPAQIAAAPAPARSKLRRHLNREFESLGSQMPFLGHH